MYGLAEHKDLQAHQPDGRDVAVERPARTMGEVHEMGPYVVRDLSWELARYLDAQDTTKEGR
jgi:hypothetical protein